MAIPSGLPPAVELSAIVAPQETPSAEQVVPIEPTWALEMEPLPQIVDSITTQLDAKTMNAALFGLPPVEVSLPTATPTEPSSYSHVALGAAIPDEVLLVEEAPALQVPEPIVQETIAHQAPETPADQTPASSYLASADMAKLLQELAERLPPSKPIEPLALPTLHASVQQEPTTPAVELPPEAVASIPPEIPAPVGSVEPTPDSQLVSAVSLFAKLAQAATPNDPTPTEDATDEPKVPEAVPKTRPRPLITVSKSTAAEPARKNWLTWWK